MAKPVADGDERRLTVELAAAALVRAAPDELAVLDAVAQEYFTDPSVLLRTRPGDSPLGSGIEIAMLAPYVLAAVSAVLPLLGEIIKGVAVDVAKEPASAGIRRLIRRDRGVPPGPVALDPGQARAVRQAVVDQCFRLGLPSGQAALIADATVGSLQVRP